MGGEGKEVGEDSREFAPDFSLTQKKRYLKKKKSKIITCFWVFISWVASRIHYLNKITTKNINSVGSFH